MTFSRFRIYQKPKHSSNIFEEVLEEVVLKEILEEVVLKEILEEVLVEVEHFRKKYGVNKTNSEFRIAISVGGIQILI